MVIIDYLYYWFFQYYKRKCKYTDKDAELCYNSLHLSTSIAVSTMLFLILFCLYLIIGITVPLVFSINKYLIAAFTIIICILLFVFVKKRYNNKTQLLNDRFKDNPFNKKLKGWMMYLFMIGLFLLPIALNILSRLLKIANSC